MHASTTLAEDPIVFDENLTVVKEKAQIEMDKGRSRLKPFARGAVRLDAAIKAIACLPDNTFRHCFIRDLSSGGAKLEFLTDTIEEEQFLVFIPVHNIAMNCTRIWQRRKAIGIQFEHGRPDIAALACSDSAFRDTDQILAA